MLANRKRRAKKEQRGRNEWDKVAEVCVCVCMCVYVCVCELESLRLKDSFEVETMDHFLRGVCVCVCVYV